MVQSRTYDLALTTQGPTYPPSEIMNEDGDFVVIGRINRGSERNGGEPVGNGALDVHRAHGTASEWGGAIVSPDSPVPAFGTNAPYRIVRALDWRNLSDQDQRMVLCTLPVPLPTNNYAMRFAPEQANGHNMRPRPSYPLHAAPIPDLRHEDGLRRTDPITLGEWVRAKGALEVSVAPDGRSARFEMQFSGLIADSLYTIMSLRERDFDPLGPTRPGPLGIPNVMITNSHGEGSFWARLPNPFPASDTPDRNRVVNVVLLWMSYQMSYGGALGLFGLGGDVHAQLKLPAPGFSEFVTTP
ncbi:hypothetical protein FW320_01565 [Azospirillum sp. Vi22]|uniref:hypothetical protein n=1 Tax=Azospirillum baldaniorum TaxID=1064539 RepID=UPI00157B4DD9|nr:hypothetical protein [Azospirillum baldaniorum]NUB04883.1 hypothetical protein [Azospirillum baldaniorum]